MISPRKAKSFSIGVSRPGIGPGERESDELLLQIPLILAGVRQLLELLEGRRKQRLTVEEFAAEVGRTPFTVRRWIAAGLVDASRVAGTGPRGRLLIGRDQLHRLIDTERPGTSSEGGLD
jgi:hypothetical protein